MSGLVTIASFLDAGTAHALRGRLEAEGIYAIVADDHTLAFGIPANALGGVKVKVIEEDAEEALEIKRACEAF
jgi:hypothetical protein